MEQQYKTTMKGRKKMEKQKKKVKTEIGKKGENIQLQIFRAIYNNKTTKIYNIKTRKILDFDLETGIFATAGS